VCSSDLKPCCENEKVIVKARDKFVETLQEAVVFVEIAVTSTTHTESYHQNPKFVKIGPEVFAIAPEAVASRTGDRRHTIGEALLLHHHLIIALLLAIMIDIMTDHPHPDIEVRFVVIGPMVNVIVAEAADFRMQKKFVVTG